MAKLLLLLLYGPLIIACITLNMYVERCLPACITLSMHIVVHIVAHIVVHSAMHIKVQEITWGGCPPPQTPRLNLGGHCPPRPPMANAVLARQPQFSKFEYWSSNLNFLIENLKIADLHPQKSAFYHKSFFTIRLQLSQF